MTVADLLLWILVLGIGVVCVMLFSKFSKIKGDVEKLIRGSKVNVDQPIRDAIVCVQREIGEKADGMFRELSAKYTSTSVVTDKLGEQMIAALLGNPGLSQEFLRILTTKIVDRDTTLSKMVGDIVVKMPALKDQILARIEALLDPESGNDNIGEVLGKFLEERLPTFLAEWLADPSHRVEFVEAVMRPIVDDLSRFVESEYEYQRDNDEGGIVQALKKVVEEVIAADLANPESPMYQAVAAEIREAAEEQFRR